MVSNPFFKDTRQPSGQPPDNEEGRRQPESCIRVATAPSEWDSIGWSDRRGPERRALSDLVRDQGRQHRKLLAPELWQMK